MASSFGGTIKLQGESEYRKALKDITSNLRLMSSELKLTNTAFSSGDKSVKQTKTSYESMNKAVQDQKAKITELRTALAQAEKEYGSNNEKVKMFKTQLNNAENQLKQMESATDKSTKELKEMKEGFDDAGNGAVKFGDLLKANVLGNVITGGLKALGSAVAGVGKAFVNIGKQALQSYASYEQLVGGVETLFKDSAGIVENYANNAYKTSGLSANKYMETVTSFSASLLQSLGGDTKKAAEVGDMAITDMSDNANKMGTSMEMIQNAYQGFAKQNYTMLDNLKLGYGGTKSEMERLLKDATAISGVEYDISSLNDVYQAIHVIQGELGITGTTSKEASETISGSLASVKSAWENILTGIADDNANFGDLINNFVDGLVIAGENLLPRIEIIIGGVVNLVLSLATKLIEHLPTMLQTGMSLLQTIFDGIMTMIPQLMPVVVQIVTNLVTFLTQNLPMILQAGITILMELIKGIGQALPELIPAIVDAVVLMVETLIDNIDLIIDAGIQLILGLADGLIEALPRLIEKAPVIIQKLVDAVIRNFPKIVQAGGQLIGKLAVGIVGSLGDLLMQVPKIITTIVNGIKDGWSAIKNAGKDLVSGIWEGITGSLDWIKNKIKGWVGNVTSFIKKLFGINSPSRVMRDEVGTFLAQGIGVGFEDEMSNVSKDMASAIPTEFDTSINANYGASSSASSSNYDAMVGAFKQALQEVKVVMNDREMGTFVADTMERVVYN
jgi:phage-related protein